MTDPRTSREKPLVAELVIAFILGLTDFLSVYSVLLIMGMMIVPEQPGRIPERFVVALLVFLQLRRIGEVIAR